MIMFDAWYNQMLKNSDCKFDLGMTDTDSFLFKVSNVKKFQWHFKNFMDYSNYKPDHESFTNVNKAKLGYFKDELCGKLTCKEFVGLRSKCYAMNLEDKVNLKMTDKKVCKGIGRAAIKNRLKFKLYKDCLFDNQIIREKFHGIRSVNHQLKTVLINKRALSFIDTKRWIFNCGLHSVPYGSFIINQYFDKCPRCEKSFSM